jgi:1L-myo-inositol 1-phosphate cytidylyltransferase / CDP-L-myo-inositol myo-inositolphosphotransferase
MSNNTIIEKVNHEPEFCESNFDNGRLSASKVINNVHVFKPTKIYSHNLPVTTALILAAGDGTRLYPLTKDKPKVMIKIWGVPILERLLHNLKKAGITKVVIVVGYKSSVIKEYFGRKWNGIETIYKETENYCDGILTSAVKGRGVIDERFVLLLGDTIFETGTIRRAVGTTGDLVVGVRNERIDESVGALIDSDNRISSIGMLKEMNNWNRVVTGLAVCEPVFLDVIKECVEKGNYNRPSAMQLMVEKGCNVKAFDMTKDAWWETDDHKDLERCEDEIFKDAWMKRFSSNDINIFKRLFNLPISLPLTKLVAVTNIKPNHLTAVALCLALLACAAFVFEHFIVGGLLCYACAIFDAVDGKISRLKLCQSDFGSFVDSVVDRLTEIAIVAGLSYGLYLNTGELYPFLIGFFACAAWLGRFYLKELFIDKAGIKAWKSIATIRYDLVGHRDVSFFIIMVCCIVGYPIIPLIWMAFFGNLLSIVKLYKFCKYFYGPFIHRN